MEEAFDFEAAELQLSQLATGTFDDLPPMERLGQLARMGDAGSPIEVLRTYQALRDEGTAAGPNAFFLLAHACRDVSFQLLLGEFASIEAVWLCGRIEELEKRYGMRTDETWPAGEPPAEWVRLDAWFGRLGERHWIMAMLGYGEREMGALLLQDPDEFHRRFDEGRRACGLGDDEPVRGP